MRFDIYTVWAGFGIVLLLIASATTLADGGDRTTRDAIRQTALDYIEGWYEGDAERMRRSLHPGLVKRVVKTEAETGKTRLEQLSADALVGYTLDGYGKATPAGKVRKTVQILDVYRNAASVRIDATDWVDYLQLARFDGRWVIVNVLWELRPTK